MKNIIITGANSGLGFATAKKIAADKDSRVILACRNLEKAEKAKEEIINETGNDNIEIGIIDTSSLTSVRKFAKEYIEKFGTVDVMINNIGISPMHSGMTEDGFELVFETNYLGHFLLTHLLMEHFNPKARVLSVTSDMHNPPGGVEWKGVDYIAYEAENDQKKYAYSKLCLIYFTHTLSKMFAEEGLGKTANSFNPGFMAETNFSGGRTDEERIQVVKTTMPERYAELEPSSSALAEVATSDAYAENNGLYYDRSVSTTASSDLSYNEENEKELWDKSLQYVGLA